MKKFAYIFLFLSFISSARGFEGCGEYLLKGILRNNNQEKFRVSYIINEKSTNQMMIEILEQKEFLKVYHSLNKPSILRVKMLKAFDGTKGVIGEILDIKLRIHNPLTARDEGVEKLATLKCQ